MADRDDLEALFLARRREIAFVAASSGRRQGWRGDDLDDFVAWVNLRFIENDYALLAKVRDAGGSASYLATVVAHLAHEERNRLWGRWRSSAAARRLGPVAEVLEQLVYRDRLPFAVAAYLLRTTGRTTLSDRELAAVLAQCPARPPTRRTVSVDVDTDDPPDDNARTDARLLAQEVEDARRRLLVALAAALDALSAEERVIIRLIYWKGKSVADVARTLGVEQKPLYRRLPRLLAGLRVALEQQGVNLEGIRALLSESRPPDPDDWDEPDGPAPPAGLPPRPPRPPPDQVPIGDVRPPPDGDFGRVHPSL